MQRRMFALLAALLLPGAAAAADVPAPDVQIKAAVLAAPEARRAGATVLGYDAAGKVVTLRQGTNELVCLYDRPGDESFSVACYHKDLEPFMARGRELQAQGIVGTERNDVRWKEIESGKLSIPREPRMLYVLEGTGFDATTGQVTNPYERWVIYWPFATPEQVGLSAKPVAPGTPWLMSAGTAGAHIMISPKREKK